MNRTFFRRRRRLVLGLAFAALAAPAAGQAASIGIQPLPDGSVASMAGSSAGFSVRADLRQQTIDRHRALGNLNLSTKVVSSKVDLGPVDPWAYGLVHKTVEPTITPLQADGMRLNAIAQAYKESVASKTAPQPTKPVQSSSTSFNWNDAGVGASIAFGVALLLVLSVAIGRRRHSRTDRTGLASA